MGRGTWTLPDFSESEGRSVVSHSLQPHGSYSPWNSPGQNTGVGSLALIQRIFPTQEWNQDLLCYRWILYQLSCRGSREVLAVLQPLTSGTGLSGAQRCSHQSCRGQRAGGREHGGRRGGEQTSTRGTG